MALNSLSSKTGLFIVLLTWGLILAPSSAFTQAVTINVTTFTDEFNGTGSGTGCSLREAVQAANTNMAFGGCPAGGTGQDTIRLPVGTYIVTLPGMGEDANRTGDLDVSSFLSLQGSGSITDNTVIDGNGLDRVIHVLTGGTVEITNLTLLNGNVGTGDGGGIYNSGTLTLGTVVVDGGQSLGSTAQALNGGRQARDGGGIYNEGSLTIDRSTIRNSWAFRDGGGLFSVSPGSVMITNSTFGSSRSDRNGAGIYVGGGTVMLLYATLTRNVADSDVATVRGGDAGGLYANPGSSVTLASTLISNNVDLSASSGVSHECFGTISSLGGNLIRNNAGCTFSSVASDQVGTNAAPINALLATVWGNFGGSTPVYSISASSPAVDRGRTAGCPTVDQRGFNREATACDVGAIEIVCGDGISSGLPKEECDDGNITSLDGCSSTCRREGVCLNGVLEPGEECEDGNTIDGDGCDNNCRTTRCGNGRTTTGEDCDTGGIQTNGCETNCRSPICGDGILNTLRGEQCDDGNIVAGDGCGASCQLEGPPICGNSIVQAPEVCDDGNTDNCVGTCNSNCTARVTIIGCRDSVTCGAEQCDDGNTTSGDGCDVNCTRTGCGNGITTAGELCDDGASNSDAVAGACRTTCLSPTCGDGIVDANNSEECDRGVGNGNAPNACRATCRNPTCGDGVTDTLFNETCDDGIANGEAGRCNTTCTALVPQGTNDQNQAPISQDQGTQLPGDSLAPAPTDIQTTTPEVTPTGMQGKAARGGGCQLIINR